MANPAIRRLCIAVALHQAHDRDGALGRLPEFGALLRSACRDSPLDRALWRRQPHCNGELAFLPPGIDEGYVIGYFLREAARALSEHNRSADGDSRARLEIAFHQGLTYITDSGYIGPAVTVVCGLLSSQQLMQALTNNQDADLAIAVSRQIFEEIILQAGDGLMAQGFSSVEIQGPDGARLPAWIRAASHDRLFNFGIDICERSG